MSAAQRRPKLVRTDDEEPGLTLGDLFDADVLGYLPFELSWNGRKLTGRWVPARWTPALEERIESALGDIPDGLDAVAQAQRIREQNEAIRDLVSTVVDEWSLTESDGKPVGLDPESLKRLPPIFLRQLVQTIDESAGPKDPAEQPSDDSSSATASSGKPPTISH